MRTKLHFFCKYIKSNQNEDLFHKLFINYYQKMINKLIEIGVNPLDQDNNGNEIF